MDMTTTKALSTLWERYLAEVEKMYGVKPLNFLGDVEKHRKCFDMALQSLAPNDAKLAKPAQIGNGIFHAGVSERLVIERAQREYEYQNAPEMESLRRAKFEKFREDITNAAPQVVNQTDGGPKGDTAVPPAVAAPLSNASPVVYMPCDKHKGLPWTIAAEYGGHFKTVCPMCEPPTNASPHASTATEQMPKNGCQGWTKAHESVGQGEHDGGAPEQNAAPQGADGPPTVEPAKTPKGNVGTSQLVEAGPVSGAPGRWVPLEPTEDEKKRIVASLLMQLWITLPQIPAGHMPNYEQAWEIAKSVLAAPEQPGRGT
jgi:hypothetical protein